MRARAGDDASADVREEEDFEVDDAMDDASDDESDDESGDESDASDDDASDDDDDDDDGEDDRSVRRDRWDEFYRLRSMIDDTDEGRVARAMALRAFQDEVRALYAPENLHSGESDSDYENGNESVSGTRECFTRESRRRTKSTTSPRRAVRDVRRLPGSSEVA